MKTKTVTLHIGLVIHWTTIMSKSTCVVIICNILHFVKVVEIILAVWRNISAHINL